MLINIKVGMDDGENKCIAQLEDFMLKVIPVTFAIFASLILTGCSSMNNFSKSLGHHEVYTETVIATELEEVWAVITDAPNYKNWNPVITNAEGNDEKAPPSLTQWWRMVRSQLKSNQKWLSSSHLSTLTNLVVIEAHGLRPSLHPRKSRCWY